MTEEKNQNVEPALNGYKEKIMEVNKARMTLQRDLYFVGMTQRGYEVEFDANMEEGCSPTETLLLSIAGCLSIDMVHMLRKMRCEVTHYEMEAEGQRNPTPPQSYISVDLKFTVSGEGITPKKVDRAVALSKDKYCSVYHSLRKDIDVNITYEIV